MPLASGESSSLAGLTTATLVVVAGGALVGYVIGLLPCAGVFAKAGFSTGAAFVPLYNIVVLLRIVGRPTWWLVLCFVPLVNVVVMIIIMWDLAAAFGKDAAFGIGLILLPWIFMLILWLGSAEHRASRQAARSRASDTPDRAAKTPDGAAKTSGPIGGIIRFVREVVAELKKVVRPTRAEVITYTTTVLAFVAVVMGFVLLIDIGIGKLTFWVFGGSSAG